LVRAAPAAFLSQQQQYLNICCLNLDELHSSSVSLRDVRIVFVAVGGRACFAALSGDDGGRKARSSAPAASWRRCLSVFFLLTLSRAPCKMTTPPQMASPMLQSQRRAQRSGPSNAHQLHIRQLRQQRYTRCSGKRTSHLLRHPKSPTHLFAVFFAPRLRARPSVRVTTSRRMTTQRW
jgi:hypothetical protein